jgi:hypothetical protein
MVSKQFTPTFAMLGIVVLASLTLLVMPVRAGDDGELDGDDERFSILDSHAATSQLAGPDAESDDFRGKVTLVVFWDGDYNSAKGWFDDVKSLQKKYYETGKFMVVATQTGDEESASDLRDFCKGYALNFPLYQKMALDGEPTRSPEVDHAPTMKLLDSEGNTICTYNGWYVRSTGEGGVLVKGAKGSFDGKAEFEMIDQIEAALEEVPIRSAILGNMELVEFEGAEALFQPGQSIERDYKKLARIAKKAEDDDPSARELEAADMIDAIDEWAAEQVEMLEDMKDSDPAGALMKAEMLYVTLKGFDDDDDIRDIGREIRKDRNVGDLVTLINLVDEINDQFYIEGYSRDAQQSIGLLERSIKSYTERRDLDLGYQMEAKGLIRYLRLPVEAVEDLDDDDEDEEDEDDEDEDWRRPEGEPVTGATPTGPTGPTGPTAPTGPTR